MNFDMRIKPRVVQITTMDFKGESGSLSEVKDGVQIPGKQKRVFVLRVGNGWVEGVA